MIFDYFWGKIRLFLMSLWRALQSGNSPVVNTSGAFLFISEINNRTEVLRESDIFV